MSDTILDAVRSKYPQYKDVPDDTLTYNLGTKYPQYLGKDKDFDARFKGLTPSQSAPELKSAPLPTAWEKFRESDTGHGIFGPTEMEQRAMADTGLGPPKGQPGILPLAYQTPMLMDVPEIALAEKLPKIAKTLGVATKGLYAYWVGKFAASQPDRIKQIEQQFKSGDKQGAWKNITDDLMGLAMNTAVAGGLVKGFLPKPPTKGVPNASQNQEAAAVHGDVRQQQSSTAEVPTEESGQGVRARPAEVAKEDQVSLTPEQLKSAEDAWSRTSDAAKIKLAGKGADIKGWADLTEDEQHQIGQKMGFGKQETPKVDDINLTGDAAPKPTGIPSEGDKIPNAPRDEEGLADADYVAPALKQLPVGSLVKDRLGNVWKKNKDGTWSHDTTINEPGNSSLQESDTNGGRLSGGKIMRLGEGTTPNPPEPTRVAAAPKPVEDINLTGVERPAAKTEDVLSPEHQKMLDIERGNTDVPVDVVDEKEMKEMSGGDPFAKKVADQLGRAIATIDRAKGRIVLNPKLLKDWLQSIPQAQQHTALRSLIAEERIHLAADDAGASAYWKNLTGLEQAIVKRRYGNVPGMNDTLWGHEALRFRMQQLARMTPREIAESAGSEKWTLKGLTVLESAVRGIREAMGTKASRESLAILDRIQQNITFGKSVLNGSSPGAVDKNVQDRAEKEAQELEKQARMYIESGDTESGNELNEMAKKLRGQTGEQYFPMAAPKEEVKPMPGERLVTVQRQDGSTYQASFGDKYYDFPGRGKVASIAKPLSDGRWTHGMLGPGEKIIPEVPGARPKKRQDSVYQEGFVLPGMDTVKVPGSTAAAGATTYTPEGEAKVAETPAVAPTERPTTQELGLPQRPTGTALEGLGVDWMHGEVKGALEDAAARAEGQQKEVALPKFKDFVAYMKSKNPAVQEGQLREMWQNTAADAFEDLPGSQLRELGKGTFSPKQTMAGIKRIEELPLDEQMKAQSGKEGRTSVWDRQIPDKQKPGGVIDRFRQAEKHENEMKAELDAARKSLVRNPGEISRLEGLRKDATFERMKLKEGYEDAIRGQNWRNRVVSALYRKMVKPQLDVSDAKLNRKDVTPEEIRHGAPFAYEDIYKAPAKEVEAMLRDTGGRNVQGTSKFGRSSGQAQNVTKRLMVIQNPRSGTVHMVDVYPRGDEVRVLDPISPTREHVPLDSILRRYRPLYTVLLDEPIRNFRKDYKNLPAYMRDFGQQAEADKKNAAGYEPTSIPESEFIGEVGGRIAGSEEGHLQGPKKQEVTELGEGEMEKGEKTPLTDAEAKGLLAHIKSRWSTKNPSEVEEALRNINPKSDRQAFSAIAKLGRALANEYPFATPDELVSKLSQRISDADLNSNTATQFQVKLMQDASVVGSPAGKNLPQWAREEMIRRGLKPGRTFNDIDLEDPRVRAAIQADPTLTFKEKQQILKTGSSELPMAAPKPKVKDQARQMEDDLFYVSNQHVADVEKSFDEAKRESKERGSIMPPSSVKKINEALDEEHTLGQSDIKLTPNEEKKKYQYDNLNAENHEMYAALKNIDPNAADPNMLWSRMAKDPNSVFQQYFRDIRRSLIEGWFSHRRTFKSLTDDNGNRRVVAIVREGKGHKLVAYDKGKGTDLGSFAWGDLQKRYDKMNEELAPITDEIEKLSDSVKELTRTPAREATSKRLINSKNKRLAELHAQRESIESNYPIDNLDDKVFVDKNGKQYKIGEATIREVEGNTDTRYYSDPYAVLKQVNLSLRSMLREASWLENFKKSPQFKTIAVTRGETGIPPEWFDYDKKAGGSETLPFQLRNYIFEPRVRDVLNQFHEQRKMQNANRLAAMNKFLQGAVFMSNPFLHTPNLQGWWFTTRGALNWLNPVAYPRLAKTFTRAFLDVTNKSPEYIKALRAGTPLQYTRMRQFGDNIMQMLKSQLDEDPSTAKKLANFIGYANPIKLSQAIGHAATAGLHDVLTMQLIHELRMRNPKMDINAAMREVTKIMPDYRVPSRVLGQRSISRLIRNPNVLWFGAYHYAEGKAFTNLAKGLVKGEGMTRGAALDKIAAIALLSAVAYPILDDILHKVTGRKDLSLRRAGPTTWPTAISDVMSGQRTPTQAMPSFISISPTVTIPISLLYNVALGGRSAPIYNPKGGLANVAGQVGQYAMGQINQGQMFRDLKNGKTDWETIGLNLAGIRRDYSAEPASKIYGWAYDYAKATNNQRLLQQFNERAMEVYPPSKYAALKSFLSNGNNAKALAEIRKLIAGGTRPELIEREMRPDTHPLSGLKDTEQGFFESLTPDQKRTYQEEQGRREAIYRSYLELVGQ